jgi:hypothetical protein
VAERIAAWKAKYADAKIVIEPLTLSAQDKAAAEAIFGPLERTLRKWRKFQSPVKSPGCSTTRTGRCLVVAEPKPD